MKSSFHFDEAALDVFSSEGAPPRQEPPLPECVLTAGAASGFHVRRMPELRVACPAAEGQAQRYRAPLWRPFKGQNA